MEPIEEVRPGAPEAMAAQIAAGWIHQSNNATGIDEAGGEALQQLLETELGAVHQGGHRLKGLQLSANGGRGTGWWQLCRDGVVAQDGAGLALGGGQDRSLRGGEIQGGPGGLEGGVGAG
ncbi:MAG: hypothetical protein ACK56I_33350, partial [bacterium]